MLTLDKSDAERFETATPPNGADAPNGATVRSREANAAPSRLAKMLRVEWLGQTFASICWIASVFVYQITSFGDWLQLAAASAWLVANIAAVVAPGD